MIIVVKSEDKSVKNFGFVAYDETGIKNIAFIPFEEYENFINENKNAEVKTMKVDQSKIVLYVPCGAFKDEPIVFEKCGEDVKFLIKS